MYIAIVGSRNFSNLDLVKQFINTLDNRETIIVSGGATGVDNCAKWYGEKAGFRTKIFYANWARDGKQAGFNRNSELVNFIKIQQGSIHAFWDGKSKGTLNTIHKAEDARVRLIVHKEDGSLENMELPF